MRKSELNAVVAILEQDAEDVEAHAKAIIDAYETARADRPTYAGIIQLDFTGPPQYAGVGYYPGVASARAAVLQHPAAGMAKRIAVVPVVSPKGLTLLLDKIDTPPEADGVFAIVKEDAALFRKGWDGKQATRKYFTDQ